MTNSLKELLDECISSRGSLFSGYGISICAYTGQEVSTFHPDADSVFTLLIIQVDGETGESRAKGILQQLDGKINKSLQGHEKPKRVAYRLTDNSKTMYFAKSHNIDGRVPAFDLLGDQDSNRGDTPVASPRAEIRELMNKKIVEIDI
ncbi:hypothetical protein F5Y18DRAFT_433378 [Xylariaceae sp. FL1019]|nr:hypothetical protein F5Y18DRAFT_433378 [Xylariaceae sp. FL1019]